MSNRVNLSLDVVTGKEIGTGEAHLLDSLGNLGFGRQPKSSTSLYIDTHHIGIVKILPTLILTSSERKSNLSDHHIITE